MRSFKLVGWLQSVDFRKLSHLDSSLTQLVKGHKLNNGEALVVTSKGWHRLRLIVRLGDRAAMVIPDTTDHRLGGRYATLDQLAQWVKMSLRDGVVMLDAYRALKAA
jgi:hypothetical protein